MPDSVATEIAHQPDRGRYELAVDGVLAAYVEAGAVGRSAAGAAVVELPHTFTVPAYRGRGLAAQVVQFALDHLAAQGAVVVPSCWFVAEFIDANPQYRHLLHR